MTYLAGQSAAFSFSVAPETAWHKQRLVDACQAVRKTLTDRTTSVDDVTLLAVLLMDFADIAASAKRRSSRCRVHCTGALALLPLYSTDGQRSDISQSLAFAVLHHALWQGSGAQPVKVGLHQFDGVPAPLSNFQLRLDRIIWQVNNLVKAFSNKTWPSELLLAMLSDAEAALLEWSFDLPEAWHPTTLSIVNLSGHAGVYERFVNSDVACVYNKWRCTQLLLLQLRKACGLSQSSESTSHSMVNLCDRQANRFLADIRLSVEFFLGAHIPDNRTFLRYDAEDDCWYFVPPAASCQDRCAERYPGEILSLWHFVTVFNWLVEVIDHDGHGLCTLDVDRRLVERVRRQLEAVKGRFGA